MAGAVGGASGSAAVQTVTQLGWLRALSVVDHEVDRHLALQAADVPVAEVVAQLVHLECKRENECTLVKRKTREPIRSVLHWRTKIPFSKREAAD